MFTERSPGPQSTGYYVRTAADEMAEFHCDAQTDDLWDHLYHDDCLVPALLTETTGPRYRYVDCPADQCAELASEAAWQRYEAQPPARIDK